MSVLVNLHSVLLHVAVVTLHGDIGDSESVRLRNMITMLVEGQLKQIVVDCDEAISFSQQTCATVSQMTELCRKKGGDLRLAAVSDSIQQEFITLHLYNALTICSTREVAAMTFAPAKARKK